MKIIAHLVLLSSLAFAGFLPTSVAHADDHERQVAVLVTGASSGIGRRIAETLAANGHFVYAGARKQADIDELSKIDNVMGVRLDVTNQDEVDAVVALVEKEGRPLHGLVNNAGIAVFGPLHTTPDEELEFLFDVNVDGVVRVTRAFAPMIIANRGRIVSTGSISGILSSPTLGAYSMSKHAIEAFTDSLAAQLAADGVSVSVVEPGNYKSDIRETTAKREMADMQAAGIEIPAEMRQQMEAMIAAEDEMKEPEEVAEAFMHALFSDVPLRRYMVVPNQREAEVTIRKAAEELVQLNAWGSYRYDRDQLVEMLDEALAAQP